MKLLLSIISLFSIVFTLKAQVLDIQEVIQEQNEWCWAGVSKPILEYYGISKLQCEIAEYTRQVSTWHDFGSVDCCDNPNVGCNYWNYNWGTAGSIQDILLHFGEVDNYGYGNALSLNQVNTEITATRPFVIRWGWDSGGGHFLVGHGVNGNNIHYMNPWYGEGHHIASYDWMVDGGNHTWTHTNIITTTLSNNEQILSDNSISIYPNPVSDYLLIKTDDRIDAVQIFNTTGQLIVSISTQNIANKRIETSSLPQGVYFIKIKIGDHFYPKVFIKE